MTDQDLSKLYAQSTDGKSAEASQVFVSGGLRAALNTKGPVRDKVIKDICAVLGCTPEELTFLFGDNPTDEVLNQIFDFPDSERRRQALAARNLSHSE